MNHAFFTDENLAQKQDLFMGRGQLQAGIMVEYYLAENPVKLFTLHGDYLFHAQQLKSEESSSCT